MVTRKSALTKAIMLVLLTYAQPLSAGTFTSEKVLEWSEESQNSLFQSSIMMIGIVATQTGQHSHISRCINDWYGNDNDVQAERNNHIRSVMELYPDHHPQAIILAVVEKACGQFEDG